MKKISIVGAVVIFVCVGLFIFRQKPSTPVLPDNPSPSPITQNNPDETLGKSVSLDDTLYRYRFVQIPRGGKIRLVDNFSKQQSTQTIIQNNSCRAAINAGYYTDAHLPLGKWDNGTLTLESPGDNRLINSFVSTDETGRMLAITQEEPILYGWYFQTGPLLFLEGEPLPLTIKNDEYARRSILLALSDSSVIFLSLFGESSVLSGPFLGDVPALVSQLATQESWEIDAATNLDGGRASFFWDGSRMIDEVTAVGSVMCATAE